MSTWKKDYGYAVAKQTFVASNKYELTILAGDSLEVFDSCGDWYLGTNIHIQKSGIFPKSFVWFKKGEKGQSHLCLTSKNTLLFYEAVLTINEALANYMKLPPQNVIPIFEILESITRILPKLEKADDCAGYLYYTLGMKIKGLRKRIMLPPSSRCADYTPVTVSNYSLEHFLSNRAPIPPFNPRIRGVGCHYMQVHISIPNILRQMVLRIGLWTNQNSNYFPWITQPVMYTVGPFNHEFDIEFYDLTEDMLRSKPCLVIAYDQIKQEKNLPDKRLPCGVCVANLNISAPFYEKGGAMCCRSFLLDNENQIELYPLLAGKRIPQNNLEGLVFDIVFSIYSDNIDIKNHQDTSVIQVPTYRFMEPSMCKNLKTKMYATVTNINHEGNRLLMYKLRLLNKAKKRFEPVIMSMVRGKQPIKYDQQEISSVILKGNFSLDETMTFDLSELEEDFKDLYLIVELQKSGLLATSSFSPFGYAYVKLADDEGHFIDNISFNRKIYSLSYKGNTPVPGDFHLTEQAKILGDLNVNVDIVSNSYTKNRIVNTICTAKETTGKEIKAIDDLSKQSVSIWYSNAVSVVSSVFNLMSNGDKVIIPFIELAEKMSNETAKAQSVIYEELRVFINDYKAHGKYKYVEEAFIKTVMETLELGKKGDSSVIVLLGALPFIIEICKAIEENEKTETKFMEFLSNMFECLKQMVSMHDENNLPLYPEIYKRLITCAPKIFERIYQILTPDKFAKYLIDFSEAIDPTRPSTNEIEVREEKARFIYLLTNTDFWYVAEIRNSIKDMIVKTIRKYQKEPKLEKAVLKIIVSIFFTVRDKVVLNFFDFLERCTKMKEIEVSDFLICLLYQFPREVPIELGFKILKNQMMDAQVKFFMMMFYIYENEDNIIGYLEDPKNDVKLKFGILESCLLSASYAATPCGIKIDHQIMTKIYSVQNDFKIIPKLYSKIPNNDQANESLMYEIIHAFSYYESEDLKKLFYQIISSIYAKDHNFSNILGFLFRVLKEYSNLPNFENVEILFETDQKQFKELCVILKRIVHALNDITKLKITKKNEYMLIINSMKIIDIAKEVHAESITLEMLCYISTINEKLNNKIEHAFSLVEIVDRIPYSDDLFGLFKDQKKKTGKEQNKKLYGEIIKLLMDENQDEFCLQQLNKIREKWVEPFKFYEVCPDIFKTEAQLYRKIARNPRFFSNFYRVSFYGKGIDIPEIGKSYIYRRNASINPKAFIEEITKIFPSSKILEVKDKIPNTEGVLYISIDMVYPSCKEAENDPIYHPDINRAYYKVRFEENNFPTVYRSELIKGKDGNSTQDFLHTSNPLPTFISRMEITQKITKTVSPLVESCLYFIKETTKLNADIYNKNSDKVKNILHVISTLAGVTRIANDTIKKFLSKGFYSKQSNEVKNDVKQFAKVLKDYIGTIKKCIDDVSKNKSSITDPGTAQKISSMLETASNDYKRIEEMIETSIKEVFPQGI